MFKTVYCCKCAPNNFENEVKVSDLIFKGKVIAINNKLNEHVIVFLAEKNWKGKQQDTIFLSTGLDQASCELKVKIGESYIVYSSNGSVNVCSRTKKYEQSIDEFRLNYLFSQDYNLSNVELISNDENDYIKKLTNSFSNYIDKKIVFTLNHRIQMKNDWIKNSLNYDQPSIQIIELSHEERLKYKADYLFVTWSKQEVNEKIKERILEQMK